MELDLRSTDRLTVSGQTGTGKSTFTAFIAALAMPALLLWDPLDQYQGFKTVTIEQIEAGRSFTRFGNRFVPLEDTQQEFERVCTALRSMSEITFIVEECEQYIGQDKPLGAEARRLINRGRNWGVGVYAVTRRIQDLNKSFFDLCRIAIFFRAGLRSYDYIKSMVGAEVLEVIKNLPDRYFVVYNAETGQWFKATLELDANSSAVSSVGSSS